VPKSWGAAVCLCVEGELGPYLRVSPGWAEAHLHTKWYPNIQLFGHNRHGPKSGGAIFSIAKNFREATAPKRSVL